MSGGRRGDRAFGVRGRPPRQLLEATILLAFFYASALVPLGPGSGAARFASPLFYAELTGLDALRILAVLAVVGRAEGFAAFGLRGIWPADLAGALVAAGGAFGIAAIAGLGAAALGLANPLMAGLPPGASVALVPLVVASSMSAGYAEELFFRVYLIRRLEGAGLAAPWSAIASSLLFGGAHGAQGILGVATTTLIGFWLAWRWRDGRNIHAIAMGHGLYDSAALALALYAS